MFSLTIPEFVVFCVSGAFVFSLILFPSWREQIKTLAGGFLQKFVQDTAKTPEGAKAIYAQKIDEATANVTFVPDSSVFTDQASAASVLNDFVNIAKTLDGTMIVINGNINADNQTDVGKQLSANRAQTVANYLASQGIDQNRLIITGSGNAKYQADKAAGTLSSDASVYQSTDISFLRIEN